MGHFLDAAVIAIGLIVCIASVVWARKNYKKQMAAITGSNYRREHGLFDLRQYILGNIVASVPKKQSNSGPDPKTYDKKIPYVNHFGTLESLISKNRSIK